MNDALSLFPPYNNPNIVIEIKVHDYIMQQTFQILSTMNRPICLHSCQPFLFVSHTAQTGLVRAERGHDIGRVEFR